MTCPDAQARSLLQCYVDDEVDAAQRMHVARHLAACGDCDDEVRWHFVVKQALRRQQTADPEAVARLCSFTALLTYRYR
jgi:anti-sigma factor RsiW